MGSHATCSSAVRISDQYVTLLLGRANASHVETEAITAGCKCLLLPRSRNFAILAISESKVDIWSRT